jgi:hypothetical protein
MSWWSSVDWGALAGAAVSAYGARQAGRAAGRAGDQAAAGSEASNALLREFYDRDEQRNAPFYQGGLTGLNQYMAMLGLQGPGMGSATTGGGLQSYDYVVEGPDGMPAPNAQLYATNPQYRQAWDARLQEHRSQWRGNGYHAGSDNEWIRQGIASRFQMPTQQTGGNTPAQPTQTPQQLQQGAFATMRNAPGYQFGLQEGQGRIEASAAARGGLNSGATLRALQRYGTDYADQQGFTPYMNRLASLWGGAQTAASQMGNAGQSYGGQMAQNIGNAANARAQSTYAQGQIRQDGLGQMGYWAGRLYDNWGNGR